MAAASDLQLALPEVVSAYESNTKTKVKLLFGSSGNLYSQIQNGAPVDVFLSADQEYPKRLVAEGIGDAASFRRYARGTLVLWTPNSSPLDLKDIRSTLLQARKIAIANPRHAPYGRAAMALFDKLGIRKQVEDRLVFGENISQAAQFVHSGNADAGLIALSLARSPAMLDSGRYVEIPQEQIGETITQGAVAISRSPRVEEARKFVEFLGREATQAILRRHGFAPPEPAR